MYLEDTCNNIVDPFRDCVQLREVYLQYLLLKYKVKPPTVAVDIYVRKPTWTEVVADKKEYWVYRDHPQLLDKVVPEVKQQLQTLVQESPPIITNVSIQPSRIQKSDTVVLLQLNFYVDMSQVEQHWALLLQTSDGWDYVDPHGCAVEWAADVILALRSRLHNVQGIQCPDLHSNIDPSTFCAHYSLLYMKLALSGADAKLHLQHFSPEQQLQIVTNFSCDMLTTLRQFGFERCKTDPKQLEKASRQIKRHLNRASWWKFGRK